MSSPDADRGKSTGPAAGAGRACVTGASSGIGRAFAERLARDGYDLLLVARREERLAELAELARGLGCRAEALTADLTSAADLSRVEERVAGEPLDLLVNNAGTATCGSFAELPPDGEERLVRLLVLPTLRLTRAALPAMLARGRGAVVNVSSRAALQPHPKLVTYSAAKAFVNAFTQALAADVEGSGVRLLAVCPGMTRTELFERAGIDASAVDPRSWLTPERVVDDALRDLERGELVCLPGDAGRGEWLRRLLPQGLLRRAAGIARRLARV